MIYSFRVIRMIDWKHYLERAKDLGFSAAAVMNAADLVIVPEYRKYCEENLCGNYNKLPACPPQSGTVEEMTARVRSCRTALILQTELTSEENMDAACRKAKQHHNVLTEKLLDCMKQDGIDEILMMGAGPWKCHSCMSAYCVDAQKMADAVHMTCWADDGKIRLFSLLLTHE